MIWNNFLVIWLGFPIVITIFGYKTIFSDPLDGYKDLNPNIINLFSSIHVASTNLNYTTNWFHDTTVVPIRINLSMCPICNMDIRNSKQNSSPKDLVISNTFSKIHNIVPFVRTLRTVGCIACIVINADSTAANKLLKGKMPEFLDGCGVHIVNVGEIILRIPFVYVARLMIIHDFLKNKKNILDRVLITDFFDTIFQGDPFTENLSRDKLGISEETEPFSLSQADAVLEILGNLKGREVCKNKILNAGTFIGGYDVVFSFFQSFVTYYFSFSIEERNKHEQVCDKIDQVYVNILIRLNIPNLSYRFYNVNEEYLVCYDIFGRKFNKEFGSFSLDNKVYPLVIHLFDRIDETVISLQHKCPQIFQQADSYVREDNLPSKYKNWRKSLQKIP